MLSSTLSPAAAAGGLPPAVAGAAGGRPLRRGRTRNDLLREVSAYEFQVGHRIGSLASGCLEAKFTLQSVSTFVTSLSACARHCQAQPECGAVAMYEVRGTPTGKWSSETERMGFCKLQSRNCTANATPGTCRPWGSKANPEVPFWRQGWCAFAIKPQAACPSLPTRGDHDGTVLVATPTIPSALSSEPSVEPTTPAHDRAAGASPLYDGRAHLLSGGLNNMIMHLAQLLVTSKCCIAGGGTLLLPLLDADPLATLGIRSGTAAWLERTNHTAIGASAAAPMRRGQVWSASTPPHASPHLRFPISAS